MLHEKMHLTSITVLSRGFSSGISVEGKPRENWILGLPGKKQLLKQMRKV